MSNTNGVCPLLNENIPRLFVEEVALLADDAATGPSLHELIAMEPLTHAQPRFDARPFASRATRHRRSVVATDVRKRILRGFAVSASSRRRLHKGFENGS